MTVSSNGKPTDIPSSAAEAWRPKLADRVRCEAVGDEMLLLDRKNEKVHQVDAVGSTILALCDGEHSLEEIAGHLLERFDVAEDRLRLDLVRFVRQLHDQRIIE